MSVRRFTKEDFLQFQDAMRRDPQHANLNAIEFLTEKNTETNTWESDGKPVFWWRVSQVMRVDIQFCPELNGLTTGKALVQGLEWLTAEAKKRGFRELIFDSVYEPLVTFLEKKGFRPIGKNTFSLFIR